MSSWWSRVEAAEAAGVCITMHLVDCVGACVHSRVSKVVANHGSEFLVVNKEDQRTMKTAIEIFLAFPLS